MFGGIILVVLRRGAEREGPSKTREKRDAKEGHRLIIPGWPLRKGNAPRRPQLVQWLPLWPKLSLLQA